MLCYGWLCGGDKKLTIPCRPSLSLARPPARSSVTLPNTTTVRRRGLLRQVGQGEGDGDGQEGAEEDDAEGSGEEVQEGGRLADGVDLRVGRMRARIELVIGEGRHVQVWIDLRTDLADGCQVSRSVSRSVEGQTYA